MKNVVLPELGEGIESAVVACWHCKEGDAVLKDDDLLEVVTDKATFNIPTEFSGKVKEIFAVEGKQVKIGETLAVIEG
jgi:pyruvate/2-oxoglutarate dehydrogenase complex dihydrolipoamide acyltransferase (E2) component